MSNAIDVSCVCRGVVNYSCPVLVGHIKSEAEGGGNVSSVTGVRSGTVTVYSLERTHDPDGRAASTQRSVRRPAPHPLFRIAGGGGGHRDPAHHRAPDQASHPAAVDGADRGVPPKSLALRTNFGITIILWILGWTGLARVVRGKLLDLRSGATSGAVIRRRLLPLFLSYLIVHLPWCRPTWYWVRIPRSASSAWASSRRW